jgi:thiamine-monophosphate kinase
VSLDRQAPVSSLGEDGVVALLRERFVASVGTVGIGDDAAVFASPGDQLVMTTDTLVEGVDFTLAYFPATDLGWKAVAVNVSDLAAMGAEPSHGVATLCLPATTSVGFVSDLIEGIAAAAQRWGLELVGGDLSGAQQLSLGLALVGHARAPVLRSGARMGDAIAVSGTLGASAGGLHQLRRDPTATGPLVERHRRPQPRLELSRGLREVVSAMIDVSDGLVIDLGRLLAASQTGCEIDPDLVPVDPALHVVGDLDAMQAALFGGEDFELVFTLPAEGMQQVIAAGETMGVAVTRIGTVTQGGCLLGGTTFDQLEGKRWDHLQSP